MISNALRLARLGLAVLAYTPAVMPGPAESQNCVDYPLSLRSLLPPGGSATYTIDVEGSHAYVASGLTGLFVIDATVPGDAVIVGDVNTPGDARDVAVQGAFAYVADMTAGLQVVDVSDPSAPVIAGSMIQVVSSRCVAVAGAYAYLVDSSLGLLVVDVSDPAQPFVAGSVGGPSSPSDVAVSGAHAYITDEASGILVFDVSNPAQPVIVGFAPTPGTPRGITIAGGFAFVADDESGLQIFDLSTPALPSFEGAWDTPGSARAVVVDGTIAYVADLSAGLQVVDVSDPAAPASLVAFDTPAAAQGVAFVGGHAYVAATNQAFAIDVFAEIPPIVGSVSTAGTVRDLVASGNIAFVIDDAAGLEVIRVDEKSGPAIVGATNPPGDARAIALAGDHAYTVTDALLQVIDVSNPASPVTVGSVTPPGSHLLNGVAVSGARAYVAAGAIHAGSLMVFDISQPNAPAFVDKVLLNSGAFRVVLAGSHAYVSSNEGLSGLKIRVFSLADPNQPAQTEEISGYFGSIDASGGRLCGSHAYTEALRVYDLADPAHPAFLGSVPAKGKNIAMMGSLVYATTGGTAFGLEIVDLSTPANPTILGSLDTPGPTNAIDVSGDYVYMSDGTAGVLVARRQCDEAAVGVEETFPRTAALRLHPATPNPFRAQTTIVFDLPSAAATRVDVYDVMGRHVRTLATDRHVFAGRHAVTWDGRNDASRAVGAGVYFVRLRGGLLEAQQRVTRVR